MLVFVSKNWWLYVLRGFLAVLFGILALLWPGLTLNALIILFGIYVILEGVLAISSGIRHRSEKYWWLLLFEGIAGLAIGVFAFIWPALTAGILLVFIAIWAVVTGILEISAAVQLRKEMTGEWLLGLAGLLSVLVGIFLMLNPGTGALAVVWLIGFYALIFGFMLVYLGFKVRNHGITMEV